MLRWSELTFAATLPHALERVLLRLGTSPLREIRSIVPAGVPGAGPHVHVAMRAVAVKVILDEDGADFSFATVDPFQQWLVK